MWGSVRDAWTRTQISNDLESKIGGVNCAENDLNS